MKRLAAAVALALASSCGGQKDVADPPAPAEAEIVVVGIDDLAEQFVKLGLALGAHDPAYVDAYSGPEDWAAAAKEQAKPLAEIEKDALGIIEALDILERDGADARLSGLKRAATAALTRARMANGESFSFDEEARLLYGVTPPSYSIEEFDAALAEIDALLPPGGGDVSARLDAFRKDLVIAPEKLDAVMQAAIAECRRRTLAHYALPETERFAMRTVTDKPWSGYNWYQGDFESLIEINTDLPVYIDRAVDLGCHEGYPGHHVWNLVVDRDLRRAAGWIEFSILPLFSPQAMIGEGSANYGIELAFPGEEKTVFERDTLYPLAGLDPAKAEVYAAINGAKRRLAGATVWIARDYLDGNIVAEEAVSRLMKYDLSSRERAEQRVRFFDQYRAYVINYSIGRDLVHHYVRSRAQAGADPWAAFEDLLKSPDAAGILTAE